MYITSKSVDIATLVGQADITPFQLRVYLELLKVPPGTTVSYGELARRIGCRSAQAVGQALRRNPFAVGACCTIDGQALTFTHEFCVPCHRVIAADHSPGGFHGQRSGEQIARKLQLLEEEGHKLKSKAT